MHQNDRQVGETLDDTAKNQRGGCHRGLKRITGQVEEIVRLHTWQFMGVDMNGMNNDWGAQCLRCLPKDIETGLAKIASGDVCRQRGAGIAEMGHGVLQFGSGQPGVLQRYRSHGGIAGGAGQGGSFPCQRVVQEPTPALPLRRRQGVPHHFQPGGEYLEVNLRAAQVLLPTLQVVQVREKRWCRWLVANAQAGPCRAIKHRNAIRTALPTQTFQHFCGHEMAVDVDDHGVLFAPPGWVCPYWARAPVLWDVWHAPEPTAYNCSKMLPRLVAFIVRPGHSQAFPQAGVQKYRVLCTPPLASRVCPSAIAQSLSPASQCHWHSASEIPRQREPFSQVIMPALPQTPSRFAWHGTAHSTHTDAAEGEQRSGEVIAIGHDQHA